MRGITVQGPDKLHECLSGSDTRPARQVRTFLLSNGLVVFAKEAWRPATLCWPIMEGIQDGSDTFQALDASKAKCAKAEEGAWRYDSENRATVIHSTKRNGKCKEEELRCAML
jgi:hypothetical protein